MSVLSKGEFPIRRPVTKSPAAPQKEGLRVNLEINSNTVQLIDETGQNRGVISIAEALEIAREAELDLVEIVAGAEPPVCKILDYGKYRFQEQKKASEARKKQKVVELKEVKLRPGIDKNDYEVKLKAMRRFLEEGHKVKISLKFRGREVAHQDLGYRLLDALKTDVATVAKVELEPSLEGRQMIMVIGPK